MGKKQQNTKTTGVWTISNGLSFLRLLLAIPIAILFVNPYGHQLTILGLCFLGYLTDIGDGYVARLRKETSDVGRMLDPLADKVVILTIMGGMLFSNMLPAWFIIVVIARDVVIFFAGMYLKQRTGILVESNYMGKAAVVSIMLLIVLAMFQQDISGALLKGVMVLTLGLMAASLYMYGERFFKLIRTHSRK